MDGHPLTHGHKQKQQYRPQALNDEPRDFWRAPGMPELETLIAGPEVAKAPGSEFWVTGACKDRGTHCGRLSPAVAQWTLSTKKQTLSKVPRRGVEIMSSRARSPPSRNRGMLFGYSGLLLVVCSWRKIEIVLPPLAMVVYTVWGSASPSCCRPVRVHPKSCFGTTA